MEFLPISWLHRPLNSFLLGEMELWQSIVWISTQSLCPRVPLGRVRQVSGGQFGFCLPLLYIRHWWVLLTFAATQCLRVPYAVTDQRNRKWILQDWVSNSECLELNGVILPLELTLWSGYREQSPLSLTLASTFILPLTPISATKVGTSSQ